MAWTFLNFLAYCVLYVVITISRKKWGKTYFKIFFQIELVQRLVMLDALKPVSRSSDSIIKRTRASVDDLLAIEKKLNSGKNHYYTYEEALKR